MLIGRKKDMKEIWKIVAAVVITALVTGSVVYVMKPGGTTASITGPGAGLKLYFVSNGASTTDWWAEAKHGFDNMSEILGVSTHVMLFGEEDPSTEGSAMQSAIAAHPDGICISNAFPAVLDPMIDQALAAGIPVVQGVVYDSTYGIKAPGVYFAFGDDYRGLVNYLAPTIKQKFPGQTISVLCGAMAPEAVYSVLRIQGFEAGLTANNISYTIDVLPLGTDPSKIMSILQAYLMGHTVNVYFGTDVDATNWIGPTLQALNKQPGDIIACGADVAAHTADAIKSGYVQATVHMGQWGMVQMATLQLFLKVKYNYPPRNIGIPGIIVTNDTVNFFEKPW
jgi:ribose transport system substrate-binding protein